MCSEMFLGNTRPHQSYEANVTQKQHIPGLHPFFAASFFRAFAIKTMFCFSLSELGDTWKVTTLDFP